MSIWHCDTHGLVGPMPCCSQARHATFETATADPYMRKEFEKLHALNPGLRDDDGYGNAEDDLYWSVWKSAIDAWRRSAAQREVK